MSSPSVTSKHSHPVSNNSTNWGKGIGMTLMVLGTLATAASVYVNGGVGEAFRITLASGLGTLLVGAIIYCVSEKAPKPIPQQEKEMNIQDSLSLPIPK